MTSQNPTYQHLIILSQPHSPLLTKEFLDIALVSASYGMASAVYFDSAVVSALSQQDSDELKQLFAMLAEFDIPLFANVLEETRLFEQNIRPAELSSLQADSQHILSF